MRFRLPFFKRAEPNSRAPDGWRIYVIGDVHGCLDQLNRMLGAIERDLDERPARGHLVFLGDLVDRGPDSAGVVERLLTGSLPGEKASFLMGNHEEVLLECYDGDLKRCGQWVQYGGLQTLESYGMSRADIINQASVMPEAIRAAIPAEHIAFIRGFEDQVQVGDYLFVHAGIRPDVPLDQQSLQDLRWIRDDFLGSGVSHGAVVVHGHTIVPDIEVRPNRIAVDTGCYRGGPLSALVLEGASKGKIVVRGKASTSVSD
jgi:serine/threonine protein phosphatase 1